MGNNEYIYHICGDSTRHNVRATKSQVDKARVYFMKENWEFPEGIAAVAIHKDGGLELSIDNRAKEQGKSSIKNILGLPSLW